MTPEPCRILLVDDHPIFRECLRMLLSPHRDLLVVGEAKDGHSALLACQELKPDIILLDMAMPGLNGLECARRLRHLPRPPKVVVLSNFNEAVRVREAFRLGAKAYLLKGCGSEELVHALRVVQRGETYLSQWVVELPKSSQAESEADAKVAKLTGREREILQLLAEGINIKEIALRLAISVKTADSHRLNLMRKLQVHSLAELTLMAVDLGVVAP